MGRHLSQDAVKAICDVLEVWHSRFNGDEIVRDHGSFTESLALTHCICFGAACRMTQFLIDHPEVYQRLAAHSGGDTP